MSGSALNEKKAATLASATSTVDNQDWQMTKELNASASATSTWTSNGTRLTNGPTTGTGTVKFDTSFLSGCKVVSAKLSWKIQNPHGDTVKFGGSTKDGSKSVTVNANGFSQTLTCKAAGSTKASGQHTASVLATLTVTFQNKKEKGSSSGSSGGGGGGSATTGGGDTATVFSSTGTFSGSDEFPTPPQICYIHDIDLNQDYVFDGVTKMAHSLALKIEEEPDSKKSADYVNNAKNEPNKVTLDVTVSDVYTSRSSLTDKNELRSKSAFEVLNDLKTSRRLCQVITPLITYNKMLLGGISISQEDDIHFGWIGQLTFQEAYVQKEKKSTTSTADQGTTSGRTPSFWFTNFGEIISGR